MDNPFEYEMGYREGFSEGLKRGIELGQTMSPKRAKKIVDIKPKKRTRKASSYNKEYAKVYKSLKKKHPRTSFSALAKKAHKETKRRMKK